MDRSDGLCALGVCFIAGALGWWIHPAAALLCVGAVLCYIAWHKAPARRATGGG